eukprot:scaffold98257_cov15-Tisochrysis_lutea.AAC.1
MAACMQSRGPTGTESAVRHPLCVASANPCAFCAVAAGGKPQFGQDVSMICQQYLDRLHKKEG